MANELTWQQSVEKVLAEAEGPLHYGEIATRIVQGALRQGGATPAATVAAILSGAINAGNSPYIRLGGGMYAHQNQIQANKSDTVGEEIEPDDAESGALQSFGMFWDRNSVIWSGNPRLLGRQGIGAADVNFASQVGVYLLHDRDRTIYVGRASDALFTRLKAHTIDRLSGRWDRFSWFGLKRVLENGSLSDPANAWNHEVVIQTLEALLIESLEPPLNRKRGDNLSAIEYLQSVDPEIEKMQKKQTITELLTKSGLV